MKPSPNRIRYLIAAVLLLILLSSAALDATRGDDGRLVISGVLAAGGIVAVVTLARLPRRP